MPLTITGAQTRRVQATAVTLAGSAPLADGGNGNVDVRFGGVTRMSVKNDGSVSITGNLAISGDLTDSTNGYLNAPISRTLIGTDVLTYLQAARDAAAKTPKLDTVRNGPGLPDGYVFGGCILMRDGRVYHVPTNNTTARIFDPVTNTVITPSGTLSGFIGGVLLLDGRVFCIPTTSTTARIYDPVSDTLTTPAVTFGGAFGGGVRLPDGRVYMVPGTDLALAPTPVIYNPQTDTLTTPTGTVYGVFGGAVLMHNGLVFQVPYANTGAVIVDPVTGNVTTTFSQATSGTGYNGGVLLPDGRVFCVPYTGSIARIYDPSTNTFSTPNVPVQSSGTFYAGGVLLPDGRVFCAPSSATTARIYDPVTNTTTTPSGAPFNGSFHCVGGVLLPDGRVACAVRGGAIRLVSAGSWGTVKLPMAVLTSPFLNTT